MAAKNELEQMKAEDELARNRCSVLVRGAVLFVVNNTVQFRTVRCDAVKASVTGLVYPTMFSIDSRPVIAPLERTLTALVRLL
jgi:hypothetical protein